MKVRAGVTAVKCIASRHSREPFERSHPCDHRYSRHHVRHARYPHRPRKIRPTAPNKGELVDPGLPIDGDPDDTGDAREDPAEDDGVDAGTGVDVVTGGGDGAGVRVSVGICVDGSGGGGCGGASGGFRLLEAVLVVILAMLSLIAFHTPVGNQTLPTFSQAPARPTSATFHSSIPRPTRTTGGDEPKGKSQPRASGPGLGLKSSDVGDLKRALTLMNKRGRSVKDVNAALEVFRATEATAARYCKTEGDGCASEEERTGYFGLRLAVPMQSTPI